MVLVSKKLVSALTISTLGLCLALVSGCSLDPVNESHTGALEAGDETHTQDNSFYDEYTFKAGADWTITINMESSDFDSYLHLRGPNEFDQQADDIAPGNLNAQITTTAPARGTYTVLANSRGAGETGAYTLTISAQPGN